jgi:citrate lyase subunit beta/citryl-CoA lyase
MTDQSPLSLMCRSLLFVPGNRSDMLDKAAGLRPDVFVPDMEDSVPAGEKHAARMTVAAYLDSLAATKRLVVPRVNAVGSEFIDDDLRAVVGPHTFGVSVGKVGSAADLASLHEKLSRLEPAAGVPVGSTAVFAWLETASGVVNAPEICRATTRLVGVAFGGEDFTNDMEISRYEDGPDDSEGAAHESPALSYARSAIVTAARAGEVLALDTPFFGFCDPAGLAADCKRARGFGFTGKFAIHPSQIETINMAFSPSGDEVTQARREIAAFEEAERQGRGSTSLDDQVIDVPVVERARKLIKRHEAAAAMEN